MNAYSTANHTITFTINTIDDDEFLKTIEGQNYVRVERADIDGARHAQRKAQDLYLRKVLQVCEYCQRDSEVFCAAVNLEADSIFDVLSFIKSNFVMDCDYVTVNSIFCGNRELDIDELYHYVERFSWADWDYWHHPEDWE